MIVIGITGGIGCGKTTVAKLFEKAGATRIDMDQIAHQLSQVGQPAYQEIIKYFGDDILNADKTINRKQLANLVFANASQLKHLEHILHPYINEKVQQQLAKLNSKICVIEIPLLNRRNQFAYLNQIVVVESNEENQIKRIQQRDSLNKSQINAIMDAQLERDSRLQLADEIIYNNDSLQNLVSNVKDLVAKYTISSENL